MTGQSKPDRDGDVECISVHTNSNLVVGSVKYARALIISYDVKGKPFWQRVHQISAVSHPGMCAPECGLHRSPVQMRSI